MNSKFIGNGRVVTLSGSSSFKDEFIQKQYELSMKGFIVLSLPLFSHYDKIEISIEEQEMLFENHLKKIEMSDILFVINKGGYIGYNTSKEIKHAKNLGKEIIYMEECVIDGK